MDNKVCCACLRCVVGHGGDELDSCRDPRFFETTRRRAWSVVVRAAVVLAVARSGEG